MDTDKHPDTDTRGWLDGFELRSLGDFELDAALDRDLSALALRARDQPPARDTLFVLLATKVARFCNLAQRQAPGCERDDLLQDAFIVFDDVLRDWRPLGPSDDPTGFGRYFFAVFPLRLRERAASQHARARPADVEPRAAAPDDVELAATTEALLAHICGMLNAADAAILRLRANGRPLSDLELRRSGFPASRRTAYRRWKRIRLVARDIASEWLAAS